MTPDPLLESLPLGAFPERRGTRFTIWSDKAERVRVHFRSDRLEGELELNRRADIPGVFENFVEGLLPGAEYTLLLDGNPVVDPYARSLPAGVHGPAQIVEPLPRIRARKRRIELDRGEVVYELHVGTFTPEGTFASASAQLPYLAELGVTVLELMPIASFPGSRGWGYDGVALFAPYAPYGTLAELARFIDSAHTHGLSVILDVVYNHLGPDGNYLPQFSDLYFASGRKNPWGTAPALEKPAFRKLVLDNARYWLDTVGFDGLRLDATHELEPGGEPHILHELSAIARGCSPQAVLIAEDDRNRPAELLDYGIDAVWSDDFHHTLHVLLTAEHDGYYRGYTGELAELARVIERGQLYEGQVFPLTGKPRGVPSSDVPRERLIYALQNHDQVGNRAQGERIHMLGDAALCAAATLLLLCLPATPLLFMGQEWRSNSPFLYFTDHAGELGRAVTEGRCQEFSHFAAFDGAGTGAIPDPQAADTFERSKLQWGTRGDGQDTFELHRQALHLRRHDPVLAGHPAIRAGVVDSMLWVSLSNSFGERLVLFNAGGEASLQEVPGVVELAGCKIALTTGPVNVAPTGITIGANTGALLIVER